MANITDVIFVPVKNTVSTNKLVHDLDVAVRLRLLYLALPFRNLFHDNLSKEETKSCNSAEKGHETGKEQVVEAQYGGLRDRAGLVAVAVAEVLGYQLAHDTSLLQLVHEVVVGAQEFRILREKSWCSAVGGGWYVIVKLIRAHFAYLPEVILPLEILEQIHL